MGSLTLANRLGDEVAAQILDGSATYHRLSQLSGVPVRAGQVNELFRYLQTLVPAQVQQIVLDIYRADRYERSHRYQLARKLQDILREQLGADGNRLFATLDQLYRLFLGCLWQAVDHHIGQLSRPHTSRLLMDFLRHGPESFKDTVGPGRRQSYSSWDGLPVNIGNNPKSLLESLVQDAITSRALKTKGGELFLHWLSPD